MTTKQQTHTSKLTPTGRFRAAYIRARLERAVIQVHGRAAFEGYRSILAERAKSFARSPGNRGPDRVQRLRGYEQLWVDVVGGFSPAEWTYRGEGSPMPPRTKTPIVKWWTEGYQERWGQRRQLVP